MKKVEALRKTVKALEAEKSRLFYQVHIVDCLEGFNSEDLRRWQDLTKQVKDIKDKIKTILYA